MPEERNQMRQSTVFPLKRQLLCSLILSPEFLAMKQHSESERQEIIIGHSEQGNLILVSFVEADDRVRLISARKATRAERKDYEENVSS